MQSSSCPALSIKSSEEGAWQEGYVGGPLSQNEAGEPGLENKSRGLLYPLTCCTPHITPHPQSDKAHSLAHMALHPTPRRFLSPSPPCTKSYIVLWGLYHGSLFA